MDQHLVAALQAVVAGDLPAARAAAEQAEPSRLSRQLQRHLVEDGPTDVYDSPAAFEVFIRGGGNVPLYQQVSRALAELYQRHRPSSLLDIGCGDGAAVLPALTQSTHQPDRLDLLEPSSALLQAALQRLTGPNTSASTIDIRTINAPAQSLAEAPDRTWDLVESTFALQSIHPTERSAILADLAPRVRRLAIVEFDVPDLPAGSTALLESLITRYERGLAEYPDQETLVAQGFLMPVLTGQLRQREADRTNWEQPATGWQRQVQQAGFTDVTVQPVYDYWSSPAFLLTAAGARAA